MTMKQIIYANIFSSVFVCQLVTVSQSQAHPRQRKDSVIIYDSSFTCHSAWMVPCEYLQMFCDLVNYFIVGCRKAAFQSDRESFTTCIVWQMTYLQLHAHISVLHVVLFKNICLLLKHPPLSEKQKKIRGGGSIYNRLLSKKSYPTKYSWS